MTPLASLNVTARVTTALFVVAAALSVGCESDPGPAGTSGQSAATPTFHKDVAPIFFDKCASCHVDGAIGQFDITKPDVAKLMAPAIGKSVASGRMPPWGAQETADCAPNKPWLNDPRLTDAEKDTVAAWVASGAPLGNPADSKGLTAAKAQALSRVDLSLVPTQGFVAKGTTDSFICFPLDPKLTEDSWIQGIHFVAGNPLVAHHALLFLDPTGAAAKKAGKQGWYVGFGSCQTQGGLVAGWAPGGVPIELPEGSGLAIKKGQRLVMQVHYHPIGEAAAEDKTTVQLKMTNKKPAYDVRATLIGNARKASQGLLPGPNDNGKVQFSIPAGEANHAETIQWTMPLSYAKGGISHVRVLGVASHMHYLGKDMRIWVERRSSDAAPSLCTDKDKGKLDPCITKNCGDKTGDALSSCAIGSCIAELQSVGQSCVGCLAEVLKSGKSDLWGPCLASSTLAPGPTGSDKAMCLLHTPEFDFSWQRFYTYDAPIEQLPAMRPGDTLKMKCVFDNSMKNATLVKALADEGKTAPVDVTVGDETLDEMCLTGLYLLFKNPGN